jgi:glycosyltransferase involved in cell wall biosynthesis
MTADQKPADVRVVISALRGGGSEHVCLMLCKGWVEQGLDVELILVRAEGPYLATVDPRVRVTDLGAARIRSGLVRLARHLARCPRTPTLVLNFELGSFLGLLRLAGWLRCRVVFREGSTPLRNVPRRLLWVYRLAAQNDVIVAQNHSIARELEGLGVPASRVRIIPNPCRMAAAASAQTVRLPAIGTDAPCLVMAAGRLTASKGFDRLLRGFAGLVRRRPGARLVILGEGEQRGELAALATSLGVQDRVELPGFTLDIAAWYRRADLFVLASHFEGQPNVLIEAILHGCRVVCAQGAGGTEELMRDCGLGDCVVQNDGFAERFPAAALSALALEPARFENARRSLRETTEPARVLRAFSAACGLPLPAAAAPVAPAGSAVGS